VGVLVLHVVLSVVAVLLAVVVGLTLAQPVSGPALDALSRAYESSRGGLPRPDGTFWSSVWRSLRVSLTALAVGAPLMAVLALIGLLLPPAVFVTVPLKAMVTALLIAWDMLDYPFSLRQMRVRERVAWMRTHLGAVLGFGLVAAASLLVPLLGLLMLPIGVTAATHLVMQHEPKP
jgi:CysZ protein